MAKKKKTMVVMPGAMTDLAHRVQKGPRPNPTTNSEETAMDEQEANEPVQYDTNNVEQEVHTQVEEQQPEEYAEAIGDVDEPATAPTTPASPFRRVEPKQEAVDRKDRTAPAAKKLPKAEGRQLHVSIHSQRIAVRTVGRFSSTWHATIRHATHVWPRSISTPISRVSSTV